ncbi:hypothetical protein BDK51DRAFT_45892 [Blyttiomyces helicus]|uniref:Uncharacterized protein n=1 Tax=Blyttiomyces helicus TaxID=388810 RepID=A0A4P9W598_9FUNG|nr:hypothetical protein BDK51DRAFT_45892 [Blyttiomyces helicus]|eukprot:RKO87122.1 hypothetical protein BDK51DRAFT_45892 [Blyttiomyces helicus]
MLLPALRNDQVHVNHFRPLLNRFLPSLAISAAQPNLALAPNTQLLRLCPQPLLTPTAGPNRLPSYPSPSTCSIPLWSSSSPSPTGQPPKSTPQNPASEPSSGRCASSSTTTSSPHASRSTCRWSPPSANTSDVADSHRTITFSTASTSPQPRRRTLTLTELIIVPGGRAPYEEDFLVKLLGRLPKLESITVPTFAQSLSPSAKMWAWASLENVEDVWYDPKFPGSPPGFVRLRVLEQMHGDLIRFAEPPAVRQRLELAYSEFFEIGDEMLPSLATLEVLLLGGASKHMGCLFGIGCCRSVGEGASFSAALEAVLRFLEPTCRKVTVGRHCPLHVNSGKYGRRISRGSIIDLKLAALPHKLELTIGADSEFDTNDICTIISWLPYLSTLNFVSGHPPYDISEYDYYGRYPWEEIPAPSECPSFTDEVALALPLSLRTLNIHGLHEAAPSRIAALRARGIKVSLASETTEAHRFFWAYEREPECESYAWGSSAKYVDVNWTLPRTDGTMLDLFEARERRGK